MGKLTEDEMATPSKPTAAELEKMRTALSDLKTLKSDLANDSAITGLSGLIDITNGIGPLIEGQGAAISSYYQQRAELVRSSAHASVTAIDTLVGLLDGTIKSYEAQEKNTKDAADGTGNGSGSGTGSGGGAGKG